MLFLVPKSTMYSFTQLKNQLIGDANYKNGPMQRAAPENEVI